MGPDRTSPGSPAAGLDSTSHRHLGGFIRPDLGFGYVTSSTSSNGTDVNIRGGAGTFGVAFGSALSEDTILAFHVWDVVATNPTITVGSTTATNTSSTMAFLAFGPELTSYSKDNFYLSLSPSLTRGTLTSNGSSSDTNWGLGMRAAVGKEWWAGDHWGLGVAAHLSFSSNQDSGANGPTWTSWGTTIAFSATYN